MKINIGSYDVAVRFVGGCVILWLGAHFENRWGFIGLVPLATAVASYCPLYTLLHIDTTFTDEVHH